jgi:outer membrane immunogenic protein
MLLALSIVSIAYADTNWTGFYVGGEGGPMVNDVQLTSQQLGLASLDDTCNTHSEFSTFSPGIQLGYLHQLTHQFVFGADANFMVNTNQNTSLNCSCPFNPHVVDRFSLSNSWQSLIKVRVGRVLNWNQSTALIYLTTGASIAHIGLTYENEGGDYYATQSNPAGWLIGTGMEWSVNQNWSLRTEYAYVDYGCAMQLNLPSIYGLLDPNGHARANLSSNSILFSINYWIL